MILAIGSVDDRVRSRLSAHGRLVEVDPGDADGIGRWLPHAVGIVARAAATVDAAVIDAVTALRVIGRSGVGVDRVDLGAATRRGIPVVITPNAGTRGVAEGALALMLHLVKRLEPMTSLVRDGRWTERDAIQLGDLDGAMLAVIGYGRIGRRLAELATALGMRVIAHDPYADTADIALTDLHGALAQADVVSLHAPLTAETRGMIDETALDHIKPGAVLVNCGRGGLLDLDAAHAALLDGRLGGVGLDVYEPEPPSDHPLFHHRDVVLTPHVMALSRRASALVFEEMADGMDDVLSGRRPAFVANPEVYDTAGAPGRADSPSG
jgi:D-3-phosphoglycerate dehydrogenase / 2-oxoglutarate reductase